MAAPTAYIHGYTDAEAARLESQAEFLAPWLFSDLDLTGVHTALEVGVGVGAETRLLRRRWPDLRVIGVDVSQGSLEHARRALAPDLDAGEVQLVRGSGAQLPLATESVDAALFIWVLEHVPDPFAVMRDTARCLKPGGRLIAREVYNRSFLVEPRHPVIDEYFDALSEAQRRGGGHPDVAARLPELAERAGLEIVDFRFTPVLVDSRDRPQCTAFLRYFEGIFRSAEPQIRASGIFPPERIPEVWRAFDEAVSAPDALLCYIGGRLEARKR